MTNQTNITVSRVIDAPAGEIFDILSLPRRHRDFDGSEMIVSDDRTQRIQSVGDTFTMNMHHESQGGDYQMTNHVIAFVPNQVIGWAPAVHMPRTGGGRASSDRRTLDTPISVSISAQGATRIMPTPLVIADVGSWHPVTITVPNPGSPFHVAVSADPLALVTLST